MISFICPFCKVVREDVPTGDHILKDGYLLECDYCYEIVTVRFEISAPNKACTRLETGAANADSESNPAVSSG